MSNRGYNTVVNYELFSLSKILSLRTGKYKSSAHAHSTSFLLEGNNLDDSFSAITSHSSSHSKGDTDSGPDVTVTLNPESSPSRERKMSIPGDMSIFSTSKRVTFRQVVACSKNLFHLLICLCSNNVLLFRFVKLESEVTNLKRMNSLRLANPLIKTMNYFFDQKIQITHISIHTQTGKWLSVFTREGEIYIIPVYKVIFPILCNNGDTWPFYVSQEEGETLKFPLLSNLLSTHSKYRSKMNFLREEVHKKTINLLVKQNELFNVKENGIAKCSVWWKTFEDMYYLIYGTSKGNIVILNMNTLEEECIINTGLGIGITELKLVHDKECFYKFLLVISKNGKFHNIMLEQENEYNCYKTIIQHYKSKKVQEDGDENERSDTILMRDEQIFRMQSFVSLNKEFPCSVVMCKSRKRKLIGAFSRNTNQVSLYNPNDCRFPMFVYQLNGNSNLLRLTEKLIFSIQRDQELKENKGGEKLWVVSRILAGELHVLKDWKGDEIKVSEENNGIKKVKRNYTVFQEFIFDRGQQILGFLQGVKIKGVDEELEGCFVFSHDAVYELKMRNSPKKIFNSLLTKFQTPSLKYIDHFVTDQFGKTFNLNLFGIYEKIADEEYERKNYELAFQLYGLSNISTKKLVEKLKHCKLHDRIVEYLIEKLKTPEKLNVTQRNDFSNLLFDSYIDKIKTIEYDKVKRISSCNNEFQVNPDEINNFLEWKLARFPKDEEEDVDEKVFSDLKEFLVSKPFYEKKRILGRLVQLNFLPLVIEVSHHLNVLSEQELEEMMISDEPPDYMKFSLEMCVKGGTFILPSRILHFLLHFGYGPQVCEVGEGILLFNSFSREPAFFKLRFLVTWLKETKIMHDFRRKDIAQSVKQRKSQIENIEKKPTKKISDRLKMVISKRFFENVLSIKYSTEEKDAEIVAHNKDVLVDILQLFDLESTILVEIKELKIDQKPAQEVHDYSYFPGFSITKHVELFLVTLLNFLTFNKKNEIYHSKLFKESLVNYSAFYRKNYILKMCLFYENIKAVELIYSLNKSWVSALDCRICHLKTKKSKEGIEKKLLKTFKTYVLDFNLSGEVKEVLILKIFKFWSEMELSVSPIEKVCLENISIVGPHLSRILLSHRGFYLEFSPDFYLAIAEYYTNGLKKFDEDEDRTMANLESQILKNMKQDVLPKHNFISLSLNEVSRTVSDSKSEWLCFTCGHKFEKGEFFLNNLEFFKRKMDGLNRNEVNFVKNKIAFEVCKKQYRSKVFNQACPRCVFSYFRKIN